MKKIPIAIIFLILGSGIWAISAGALGWNHVAPITLGTALIVAGANGIIDGLKERKDKDKRE